MVTHTGTHCSKATAVTFFHICCIYFSSVTAWRYTHYFRHRKTSKKRQNLVTFHIHSQQHWKRTKIGRSDVGRPESNEQIYACLKTTSDGEQQWTLLGFYYWYNNHDKNSNSSINNTNNKTQTTITTTLTLTLTTITMTMVAAAETTPLVFLIWQKWKNMRHC